ncbi:hypothetical protein J7T55_010492 [Diaporthe amygdali]|uniref:uncharacterized protein n=1 Tax=Phomopsis amygdali TaxID=1214568 RepID=UPI0022FE49ED|nr:uncharacterized protein J7T55_010492 [Diaporthe amygdali]KAJ0115669.1 hypothetical protein J7T55_010492 [Diaporthe amygdali]
MSAPRVPGLPSDIRSAETPKDLSLWNRKRDTFYDLYICQNKTLDDVKMTMESDHGFSKTLKLSEYERILREEFKFRKNLSADDWRRSIGPQIAKRKAEGKRSKVLLNGSEVQNVNRRIKRSFRSKSSHQRAKVHTAALPYGLVIRTPSPQPSTLVVSSMSVRKLRANEIEGHETHQPPMESLADTPAGSDWFRILTAAVPLSHAGSMATVVLSAQFLREGCPINRFLTMLDEYQRSFNQADLRLFGPNTTISILGKMCFYLSNGYLEETMSIREIRSMLDWIGFSVDIAALKAFFGQKALTIQAAWENLDYMARDWIHMAAFNVLVSVRLSIMNQAPWTMQRPVDGIADYIDTARSPVATMFHAHPYDQSELDRALRFAVIRKSSVELVKQLISAGASLTNIANRDIIGILCSPDQSKTCGPTEHTFLQVLLEAGAVVDEPASSLLWAHPDSRTHATDCILLSEHQPACNSLWSLVYQHSDYQQTTVTVPGIFLAAQGGQEHLRSYLDARLEPSDGQHRKHILEVALSEASERGYAQVVQGLVQFGVDPNVCTLPRICDNRMCENHVWHPIVRAANAGQTETLQILVAASTIDAAMVNERVVLGLDFCALRNMGDSQCDQVLQVLSTLDLHSATRCEILLQAIKEPCARPRYSGVCGHKGPDFQLVNRLLQLKLACLDCGKRYDGKIQHFILRAVANGCRARTLDYLRERNVEFPTALSARRIGALVKAALERVYDRGLEILVFLAQNVEDDFRSYVQANGPSLLTSSIKGRYCSLERGNAIKQWANDCDAVVAVKWFLGLGASFSYPEHDSFLAKLIPHASDSFILEMIGRGANVNGVDDGWTALQRSIELRRLNLAVALIERGAQVNAPPGRRSGRTALQAACQRVAPLWFIEFLVDKGADVNAPPAPNNGYTALQAACLLGAPLSCISFLIEKGADVNAPPAPVEGETALQCAAMRGSMNVVGLLLDHGADANALSGYSTLEDFCRAIDLAIGLSRLDMVHFLISAGARSRQPGLTGFDGAIAIATSDRHFAIADLLQEHADSLCEDPLEAERKWLQANPQACMYNGSILPADWASVIESLPRSSFEEYIEELGIPKPELLEVSDEEWSSSSEDEDMSSDD